MDDHRRRGRIHPHHTAGHILLLIVALAVLAVVLVATVAAPLIDSTGPSIIRSGSTTDPVIYQP